jgi:hypothetical protein
MLAGVNVVGKDLLSLAQATQHNLCPVQYCCILLRCALSTALARAAL